MAEISTQARASVTVQVPEELNTPVSGVSGTYTLESAVRHALAGTGLRLEPAENNAFRIVRVQDDAEIIVVRGRRTDFARTSSSLLTRTETPLRQTPGTVNSVTEEVLHSQNALSVSEALRNIPGALFTAGAGTVPSIGGQQVTNGVTFTNGLRNTAITKDPPITDVEAIEVIKGPSSLLTGTEVNGGVINFVPKRATGARIRNAEGGYGSGNEFFGSVDIGGTLSQSAGLFARVVLLATDADRVPGGGLDPHQYVINPIFGLHGARTRFDISIQYYDKRSAFRPLIAYIPETNSFTRYGDLDRRDVGSDTESTRIVYNLEHDFSTSDDLTLRFRNRGLVQRADDLSKFISPLIYDFLGKGSLVQSLASDTRQTQISQYADIYAKFSTGIVEHQLIVAIDYSHLKSEIATNLILPAIVAPGTAYALPADPTGPRSDVRDRQVGLVLQDQVKIGPLHLLLALRQSFFKNTAYGVNVITQVKATTPTRLSEKKLLPTVGAVYDLTAALSAYVSYSTAFTPSTATGIDGETLPPQLRKRFEGGVKWGAFNNRLNINLSAYRLRTSNSTQPDPLNPALYIVGPGLRGHGYEASISGSITPSLTVLTGYSYNKLEGVDHVPENATPRHIANLWLIKTVKTGTDQVLTIGAGGNYNSGFYALNNNPLARGQVKIDRDYLAANASLGYAIGTFSINAVINNIFDRANFAPSAAVPQLREDVPRSVRITLRKAF